MIALVAPKVERARGIFPTSLYGQSAPGLRNIRKFSVDIRNFGIFGNFSTVSVIFQEISGVLEILKK
jgi:hypothetical protein